MGTRTAYAFQSLTSFVGTGRKTSVNISRLFLAVSFQSLRVSSERGSATALSSGSVVSSMFGQGAGLIKDVTGSVPVWHICGGIKPRCSAEVKWSMAARVSYHV